MKNSKYLSAARSILEMPRNEDSWIFIIDSSNSNYLWTDEDVIEGWNKVARKAMLPPVKRSVENPSEGERTFLTYKDTTVEVPLTDSRDDQLVIVHTLARLVRRDSDIRFCVDSYHSSDLAFLALAPAEWKAVEKEFGAEAVAYRFLPFAEKLKEFQAHAFSRKNNRKYKPLAYAPAAGNRKSGKAGGTVIALEDSAGILAGYAVLSRPLIATFEFLTCRLVASRSRPSTPIMKFLSQRKDYETDVVLEVRRDRAQISGMFPGYDGFLIKLGKRGDGTWEFFHTNRVLPSGRCHLVLENAETILVEGK